MSNPYIVFAVVFTAASLILLGLAFMSAMLVAFYPDDLNDHKDN